MAARVLGRVIDGAAWAGSRMPARPAHALATIGGHAEWALRPRKRRMLAANLCHALELPADHRTVRRTVRHEIVNEAHRSADLLWALGRPDEFARTVQLDGAETLRSTAEQGRGMIVVGMHLGGWELATGLPRVLIPVPTTVIVADDWLAWAISHMRVTNGLRIMYRSASAIRAARLLRAGEALLMLGDDGGGAANPRTHAVRLLDSTADIPAGMATLSRLCQSPIVTFAVVPIGRRRWRAQIGAAIEPPAKWTGDDGEREVVQRVADRWTELLRAYPEHWAAPYRIGWHEESGA
jgi:lauroyl/myristoyl acyltransferase